jgi:hypothetical protein
MPLGPALAASLDPSLLAPQALALLDQDLRPVIEPGRIRLLLGSSSQDLRLRGVVEILP